LPVEYLKSKYQNKTIE